MFPHMKYMNISSLVFRMLCQWVDSDVVRLPCTSVYFSGYVPTEIDDGFVVYGIGIEVLGDHKV